MIFSCYVNRLRGYPLAPQADQDQGLLGHTKLEPRDEDSLDEAFDDDHDRPSPLLGSAANTARPSKKRSCCGTVVTTPDTSRFANYWHSRFIQKFPFLVEMFYWAVNLLFYVGIKQASELIFATDGIWKTAENHGIAVLWFEHESPFRFFFPLREVDVQMWFRTDHQTMLTILNRAYSLIHIPVTVR